MSSATFATHITCSTCGKIQLKNLLLPISETTLSVDNTATGGYQYNMFVCMRCASSECSECFEQRWMLSSFANHKECQICKNKMKLVYYNNKTQGFSIIH